VIGVFGKRIGQGLHVSVKENAVIWSLVPFNSLVPPQNEANGYASAVPQLSASFQNAYLQPRWMPLGQLYPAKVNNPPLQNENQEVV